MPFTRRLRHSSRAMLMALLVFGLLVQPVLAALGELHAVEHVAAGLAGDGHGHDHAHPDADDKPGHPLEDPAPDSPSGLHGLMHAGMSPIQEIVPPQIALAAPCPSGGDAPSGCETPGIQPVPPNKLLRPPIA